MYNYIREKYMDLKKYIKYGKKDRTIEGSRLEDFWCFLKSVRPKKSVVITGIVLIAGAAVILGVINHVDQNYRILASIENEDTQSSEYVHFGNDLLKYGDESVSLLSQSGETLWSQNYEMSSPESSIRGSTAVIYDKRGTSMYVIRTSGPVGPVATDFPIVKAEVAENGSIAAILEDGEKTWINYYASDGSLIVENQTRMENNGYPLDLAVSPDGEVISVSYLMVESGEISSQVVFYNFGQEGQEQVDNIVAEFTYEDTVVPDLVYFDNNTCVAFRDDGFSVFQGNDIPEERKSEEIDQQLISLFYNEEYFGIVTAGEEQESTYLMTLYDSSGRERSSRGFDMEYQSISFSGEKVILCAGTQVEMYNLNGRLKFQGDIQEGMVRNLFRMSRNRYFLISDEGISMIQLRW